MAKYGFGGIKDGRTTKNNSSFNLLNSFKLDNVISTGRVVSIILDDTHPRYEELGGPKAIGFVEFVDYKDRPGDYSTVQKGTSIKVARPFFTNVKNYPVVNELISTITGPTSGIQQNTSNKTIYYLGTINLWNHPHHNGIPYSAGSAASTQNQTYLSSTITPNLLLNTQPNINFGNTFKEKTSIRPLQAYEGDIIYEGRWGNSIRFGSTAKTTNNPNPWSQSGLEGNPITIIRNGQPVTQEEGWNPVLEDINEDYSSIYLTNNQQVPFKPSSINNFFSYNTKPIDANSYTGNQIIVTSGRLYFNTKEDHLLLSSAKSINLNAVESINIDTIGTVIMQAGRVNLGSKNATEPVLLGDTTAALLKELISIVKILSTACKTASNPGGPVTQLQAAAAKTLPRLAKLNTEIIKSQRTFTV